MQKEDQERQWLGKWFLVIMTYLKTLISFFADIVPNLKRIQNEALKLIENEIENTVKKCNKQIQKWV